MRPDTPPYQVLGFDPEPRAIIEPGEVLQPMDIAPNAVMCFFLDVIERVAAEFDARIIYYNKCEMGTFPVYEMVWQGRRLVFYHPGLGGPLAAGNMEEAIARGVKHFVACGGAGRLDGGISLGHLLVPEEAYRDEGTSYHYLAPSLSVRMQPKAVSAITRTLEENELPYLLTKTWTTDAFYRETRGKAARFRELGCLCVEMEAASLMAVAEFRGVDFGQILYGGDAVLASGWDAQQWTSRSDIREGLFWLAADACLGLGG